MSLEESTKPILLSEIPFLSSIYHKEFEGPIILNNNNNKKCVCGTTEFLNKNIFVYWSGKKTFKTESVSLNTGILDKKFHEVANKNNYMRLKT